ncbi:universal stress protein [Paenibacillus crassostreae]|uniref:Universal stress protein UspA n=1 Tax=Paenibacillus crassostreae TaxID=1763538 RepID=A0A167AZF6_9BACL|nr:universal stress protein [Paenibacillus crassostreae]AOZ93569.1 universal stress protein UspA [Paenibacillus crassostreae]OAB71602.1 universal stress protein UspA [Paenibacillus crassostreae]
MLFSNILVAYDGSKASKKALDHAIALTQAEPNAKITVIHVFGFPRAYFGEAYAAIPSTVTKDYYDLSEQTVQEAKDTLQAAGVSGTVEMIQGAPADVVLEYSKKNQCDVIVIGSRGLGTIRSYVLGSVSHNVVQQARVPVLVVK